MIALIHIKKTAGKSLKHIMRSAYGMSHCDVKRWHPGDDHFTAADLRRLQRLHPCLHSIAGHSIRSYSDLRSAAPALAYYTFVRDPVRRCISEYQYCVRKGRCAPGSFAAWIEQPVYRNVQVQSLAGRADLDAAIAQIDDELAFVGLMEHFDESLALMQSRLELARFTPVQRRVNAASDHAIRDAIIADADAMQRIRQANELDTALYEYIECEVYPRQKRAATRCSIVAPVNPSARPRQFNTRFVTNGAYRHLVYKPAVSVYRLAARLR